MEHSVALVDDHHLMRSGLVATVNGLGGFRVTIEAGHGRELIAALEKTEAPRIAVVDLNMPVMDGYATIAWLRENQPQILPLALTFDATEDALLKAVRVGARGFLLKSARPTVLKTALDSLILTGYYYTDELQGSVNRHPDLRTREERMRDQVRASITPREMELLRLVCDENELTYDTMALRMDVSVATVHYFRVALFKKFKLKSKIGLVLFAAHWGLLED